jgi:cytochrome c biogenesis protein CcdA
MRLGASWGLGHAISVFLFGVPIVLFRQFLPDELQAACEALVGLLIMALAVRLLWRWHATRFHAHTHSHGDRVHSHVHAHVVQGRDSNHKHASLDHSHTHPSGLGRSPLQAFGIGLVHGVGGSAAVGVLLLASLRDSATGIVALAVFALFTAVSMALASTGFGFVLTSQAIRRRFQSFVGPALGVVSLAFGIWYTLGAVEAVPYPF